MWNKLCRVPPSPAVLAAIQEQIRTNEWTAQDIRFRSVASRMAIERQTPRLGFNDGVFYPEGFRPEGLERVAARRPSVSTRARKTTGHLQSLVILVDFSDNEGQRKPAEFVNLLFSVGVHPSGSLRDYYREVSYGKLDVTGSVIGWLRMPHPYSYYVNGDTGTSLNYPHNSQGLTTDALIEAAKRIDLREFDTDGDGFVDGLFVIHAGSGAEAIPDEEARARTMWSHKWNLPTPFVSNEVSAYAYSVEPEDGHMGVFAHEFGHVLGLPDLYDTTNRSAGAGMWCLMAAGSWGGGGDKPTHLCVWSKARLGWLDPSNIKVAQSTILAPIESNPTSLRLWTHGKLSQEYFLIENRQKLGFDTSLPGEGLLIWHIDDSQSDNDDPRHYCVALEQADGRKDMERGQNAGDAADPYPGRGNSTLFDNDTKPDSKDYFSDPTGVVIGGIEQRKSGEIACDVRV